MRMRLALFVPLAALASCGHAPPAAGPAAVASAAESGGALPASAYEAIVAAPDRTEADRALDPGRHPARMLEVLEVRPGMKVAELGAGRGYTTELLARAVTPGGVVYAQNSAAILSFAGKPWGERLARPALQPVVQVDREFEAPLPPEARELDLILMNAVYHDTVWMNVDRQKMNKAVFDALRQGGAFTVIDSSARAGTGAADAKTLHRIDEQAVRDEVTAAGFKLAGESDFLRNPADARDWSASPSAAGQKRGTSDRFVLRFVKP